MWKHSTIGSVVSLAMFVCRSTSCGDVFFLLACNKVEQGEEGFSDTDWFPCFLFTTSTSIEQPPLLTTVQKSKVAPTLVKFPIPSYPLLSYPKAQFAQFISDKQAFCEKFICEKFDVRWWKVWLLKMWKSLCGLNKPSSYKTKTTKNERPKTMRIYGPDKKFFSPGFPQAKRCKNIEVWQFSTHPSIPTGCGKLPKIKVI